MMKAIVLAAGRGSRMGPATDAQPKCLIEFAGRRLLDWQLQSIRAAGIHDIGIVTGYMAEKLQPYGLRQFHNSRWAETNMVLSLACAAEWLRSASCVVSYADLFYNPDIIRRLTASSGNIAITYDLDWLTLWRARFDDPISDAETFRVNSDGRLVEIGQSPQSIDEIQGQYMGLLRFMPAGWGDIETLLGSMTAEERDRIDMTGLLNRLIDEGITIDAVPVKGSWGEIDSEFDLAACEGMKNKGAFPWME